MSSLLLIAYLLLPHILSQVDCGKCGKSFDPSPGRIWGGREASLGQYPWMVSLQEPELEWVVVPVDPANPDGPTTMELVETGYYSHACGASIIHHYWLLTAAHCIKKVRGFFEGKAIAGCIGHMALECQERDVEESDCVPHEEYEHQTLQNDIGLIKLKIAFRFDERTVGAACPMKPSMGFDYKGTADVAGWGRLFTDDPNDPEPPYPYPEFLQSATVDIWTEDECKTFWGDELLPGMFCLSAYDAGACDGDSGGPVMIRKGDTWYNIGITSWGNNAQCHQAEPNIATRVEDYLQWLESTTGLNFY